MGRNAWLASDETLIIGHRGASAALPENSLAAFALAVEHGADGVELDVQLSKDGRPVLVHDSDLLRLSGNPQKVCRMTVQELQKEDLGGGQTIATLEELFDLLGDSTLYDIELKYFGLRDQGLVERVAERVSTYGLLTQTMISSFNPLMVRRAQQCFPAQVAVALIRAPGVFRHTYRSVAVEADNPHYSLVDERYMARAERDRRRTFAWTVDDLQEARRMVALGVHGIITNEPGRLCAALALS